MLEITNFLDKQKKVRTTYKTTQQINQVVQCSIYHAVSFLIKSNKINTLHEGAMPQCARSTLVKSIEPDKRRCGASLVILNKTIFFLYSLAKRKKKNRENYENSLHRMLQLLL